MENEIKQEPLDQDKQDSFFSNYKDLLVDYAEKRIELAKLEAIEKTAIVGGMSASFVLIILFGFLSLMFVSVMLGFLFAEISGSMLKGFGLLALFYMILFLLVIVFRKSISKPISNLLVRVLSREEGGHE
ncbi:MAG: phage holin family protein [Bacteroidia bacterium]